MKYLLILLLFINGYLIHANAQDLDSICGIYNQLAPQYDHNGATERLEIKKNFQFEYTDKSNDAIEWIACKGKYIKKIIEGDIIIELKPDSMVGYYRDSIGNVKQLYNESRLYDKNSIDRVFIYEKNFVVGYFNNIPFLVGRDTFDFNHMSSINNLLDAFCIESRLIFRGYFRDEKPWHIEGFDGYSSRKFPKFFGKTNDYFVKTLINTKVIKQVNFEHSNVFATEEFDSCLYYQLDKGYQDGLYAGMKLVMYNDSSGYDKLWPHQIRVVKTYKDYSIAEREFRKRSRYGSNDHYLEYISNINRTFSYVGFNFKNSLWLK